MRSTLAVIGSSWTRQWASSVVGTVDTAILFQPPASVRT